MRSDRSRRMAAFGLLGLTLWVAVAHDAEVRGFCEQLAQWDPYDHPRAQRQNGSGKHHNIYDRDH